MSALRALLVLWLLSTGAHAGEYRPSADGTSISPSTVTATNCLRVSDLAGTTGGALIAGACASDKVGVLSSAPANEFHIGSGGQANIYQSMQTDSRIWKFGIGSAGGDDGWILQDTNASSTRFRVNTTGDIFMAGTASGANPTLLATNSGTVGIGNGAPTVPATTLEVSGDASFGSGATKSTVTATGNFQLVAGSTLTSAGTFTVSTSATAGLTGTPAIFVDKAGQVGINTTAPGDTFHVGGTAFANLYTRYQTDSQVWRLGIGSSGGDDNLIIQDADAGATRFRIDTTGNFYIGGTASGANPTMLVRNAGDVGIGNGSPTVPATTLEVNGSASFGSGATKSTFTAAGFWMPIQKTKAEIDALAGVVGAVIMCSDCTIPYTLCKGTATALSGWEASYSATVGCGSNN